MIGEILGNRYKLLRELGAGGMAWVYLAEDLVEKHQVAVKVLYPQFSQDMSYVQRFIREAKLARQISSDHIVRILNYGADRDVHYLAMENIQGKDLATILQERGKIPWREALEITAQIALALDAANAHGIVHRDIKPQNIMLTDTGVVKVLDFGIARARMLPSLTQTGFVGSPYYISPEQAMGEEVDIRSDIYSLGVVLYEMLSGKLPFDAASPWSIISQHIAQEPPTLSLQDSELSPEIEALTNHMLSKDPEQRHSTPGELLAAIEIVLRGPVDTGQFRTKTGEHKRPAVPLSKAHKLLLSSLYDRAIEAAEAEEWSRSVNLMNRIVQISPHYKDVSDRLAHAGYQVRLSALYSAAQHALQDGRWQESIDELSEIVSVDAEYEDAAELLTRAGMSLAEIKARERIDHLYQEGLLQYEQKQWSKADACFSQVFEADPYYKDIAELLPEARRRARWSISLLARVGHKLASWMSSPEEETLQDEPVQSALAGPVEGES